MNRAVRIRLDAVIRSSLIVGPLIGLIDLVMDYRDHKYRAMLAVAAICFVAVPAFSVWWERKKSI